MTAIVAVLNTQGIAMAADSAVTVSSQNGVKKVYNKGNKIFTLSKFHPVGIAIYNGATFMGIPWETLIKMYRKQLKDTAFDTVEAYKLDFLKFLKDNISLIPPASLNSHFFNFSIPGYNDIKNGVLNKIKAEEANLNASATLQADLDALVETAIETVKAYMLSLNKAKNFNIDSASFENTYAVQMAAVCAQIEIEIQKTLATFTLSAKNKADILEIFHTIANLEQIFESHSGLVFFGFGEKEIFPSSHLILVGQVVDNTIRHLVGIPIFIKPGEDDVEANIVPYAQTDVTMTVLTGADPRFNDQSVNAINGAFDKLTAALQHTFPAGGDEKKKIQDIAAALIEELDKYRFDHITKPLLDMLVHMGKEDMAELAESLVNITSLKTKFTETYESVGGPVDVAVITKGDGFVWMKRKHYFDMELNKHFSEKYYNS